MTMLPDGIDSFASGIARGYLESPDLLRAEFKEIENEIWFSLGVYRSDEIDSEIVRVSNEEKWDIVCKQKTKIGNFNFSSMQAKLYRTLFYCGVFSVNAFKMELYSTSNEQ